ncbi:hypothetical protein BH20ACI4_BH20ACI4_07290 [soil metagenome]
MSVNIIAHDTRLEGRTPASTSGTITFEVGDGTRISNFFQRVIQISDSHGGIQTLYIMAHGDYVNGEDTHSIRFCHEYISYRNIHLFAQLNEKVERIVLFVCHASETSMTAHGDGDELCRQMAIQAQAEVTAAREVQAYSRTEHCILFFCEESAIEFGEWEGTVVVYDSNGNIIAQYHNPSAWHDSEGELHDPRLEADPHILEESRQQQSSERFSRHSMRL